jgi:diguanylate cyclase (GGDEF)-like protein
MMQNRSSLNRKLIIGCLIMLSFSLVLSISLIFIFKNNYERADRNLKLLSYYRQVLIVANRLSAERGPTNASFGEEPSSDSPLRRKLADFRALSDAALASLDVGSAAADPDRHTFVQPAALDRVRAQLRLARKAVDAIIARPRADRSAADIASAVNGMFGVIDAMHPVVTDALVGIVAEDQTLAGPALVAQMLGELREFAGRVGSLATPYIAASNPLPPATQEEISRTLGRISELWKLAEQQAGLYADDPRLELARRDANASFFGKGLIELERIIVAGRDTGIYGATTAQMTDRLVPSLEPVERLRMTFLDLTIARPAEARANALAWLFYVSLVTGFIVLANIALIFSARKLVFRPLLAARDKIIALSEGNDMAEISSPTSANEMRHLFDALEGLRVRLRDRIQYTERLKVQAETDGLTGLMNRRYLDRIGMGEPEFSELPDDVALILMDIDRFKGINDHYGHQVGDRVLKAVAEIVRKNAGETDLVARYGGEEMAVIVTDCTTVSAIDLAESLREALERAQIILDDNRQLSVTASFGVAHGQRGPDTWQSLVAAADVALYRAKSSGRNRVCVETPEQAQAA